MGALLECDVDSRNMVVQDAQLEDALGRTILGVAMIYDGVFDATLGLFVIVEFHTRGLYCYLLGSSTYQEVTG